MKSVRNVDFCEKYGHSRRTLDHKAWMHAYKPPECKFTDAQINI